MILKKQIKLCSAVGNHAWYSAYGGFLVRKPVGLKCAGFWWRLFHFYKK